jgi:hypothetical protein
MALVEIELLPGASPMRVPHHSMSPGDDQLLEKEFKEMLNKAIFEQGKGSSSYFDSL